MMMKRLQTKEAIVQTCSVKKLFWEISHDSQENTCARVSFLKRFWWLLPNHCFVVLSFEEEETNEDKDQKTQKRSCCDRS